MEFDIIKEKDLPILSRKRVVLMTKTGGATPSRLSLLKELAKLLKTKEELIVIKHVYPQYGHDLTKLIVHVYSDKKKMELFEHPGLIKKHQAKEEDGKKTEEGKETS